MTQYAITIGELIELCRRRDLVGAMLLVRENGMECFAEINGDPSHATVLWDAIQRGHLDGADWYFDTFDDWSREWIQGKYSPFVAPMWRKFTPDTFLGVGIHEWTPCTACSLMASAFRNADYDNLDRCEAAADWVVEKFRLDVHDKTATLRFRAIIYFEKKNELLGLNWLVRKIGADCVYGKLDTCELDRAQLIFDTIKHVPQLQTVADRLRKRSAHCAQTTAPVRPTDAD